MMSSEGSKLLLSGADCQTRLSSALFDDPQCIPESSKAVRSGSVDNALATWSMKPCNQM